MEFVWDERKNKANQHKHNISFELATLIFDDINIVSFLDKRFLHVEERWQAIGRIREVLIFVAYVLEESENGEEIIRIITARKATSNEARRYYLY